MNSPGAIDQISQLREVLGNSVDVGAGTVTSRAELELARKAGASFIVTPTVTAEVISAGVGHGLPVFAGAFTPTEVHFAHRLGASMVKLFPAHRLGPGYLRDLRGPFPEIRLLPTGGITPESIPDYVVAGAAGFGIGGSLFPADRLAASDWEWIVRRAVDYVAAWKKAAAAR